MFVCISSGTTFLVVISDCFYRQRRHGYYIRIHNAAMIEMVAPGGGGSVLVFGHKVSGSYQLFDVGVVLARGEVFSLILLPVEAAFTVGRVGILLGPKSRNIVRGRSTFVSRPGPPC